MRTLLALLLAVCVQDPKTDKWEKDIAAFEAKDKTNPLGTGNVVYCDGHAAQISRVDAASQSYHDPLY